jgi:hypothetical protein
MTMETVLEDVLTQLDSAVDTAKSRVMSCKDTQQLVKLSILMGALMCARSAVSAALTCARTQ